MIIAALASFKVLCVLWSLVIAAYMWMLGNTVSRDAEGKPTPDKRDVGILCVGMTFLTLFVVGGAVA
jgi:hypothetical protein